MTGIQWTLDGFLYLLRNSTLNVFDAYAMTPERQLNGSEASEIFQAASINCHEVPQLGHHIGISNRSIISLNTINAKVQNCHQIDIEVIKCLEVYFDIELLIQDLGSKLLKKILKVDFFINGDQFFFFLEKLGRDIDLMLFAS